MEKHPKGFGNGPWPTADTLRLALLAKIQDAENVDLKEFFRQVYPRVLETGDDDRAESEPTADSKARQEVKHV